MVNRVSAESGDYTEDETGAGTRRMLKELIESGTEVSRHAASSGRRAAEGARQPNLAIAVSIGPHHTSTLPCRALVSWRPPVDVVRTLDCDEDLRESGAGV